MQLHCPPTDLYYHPEVFGYLDDLVTAGKIANYGVSVERVEEALKAIDYPGVVSVQIIFNIFRLRPADVFFDLAKRRNVAVIARVPLASGLLAGKFKPETKFEETDHRQFNRHGEAFDVGETFSGVPYDVGLAAVENIRPLVGSGSMAQFALRWILMFDAVTVVIPGARNAAQARVERPGRAAPGARAGDDGGAHGDLRSRHQAPRPSALVKEGACPALSCGAVLERCGAPFDAPLTGRRIGSARVVAARRPGVARGPAQRQPRQQRSASGFGVDSMGAASSTRASPRPVRSRESVFSVAPPWLAAIGRALSGDDAGEGNDEISAAPLGFIQGGVRVFQDRPKVGFARRFRRRNAQAERHPRRVVRTDGGAPFAGLPKAFRDPGGVFKVDARQQDRELVAALPAQNRRARPDRAPDDLRDIDEDDVPDVVAVPVVDVLEHVDVAHDRNDRLAQAARLGKDMDGGRIEAAPVHEPGQRVLPGQVGEFVMRRSQVAHEPAHPERNERADQRGRDRRNRQADPPKLGRGVCPAGIDAHEQKGQDRGQRRANRGSRQGSGRQFGRPVLRSWGGGVSADSREAALSVSRSGRLSLRSLPLAEAIASLFSQTALTKLFSRTSGALPGNSG